MKNAKKNIMIFGAVVIALLMVSTATAVTMPQSNESSNSGATPESSISGTSPNVGINHVEPGIYLSGPEQRKILSDALNYVGDTENRILIQEIIKKMDSKGFVDDSDVEQIISSNNLELTGGILQTIDTVGSTAMCGGWVHCIRRPFALGPVVGLIFCLWWDACPLGSNSVHITIGGNPPITYNHHGTAIGFIGLIGNNLPVQGEGFTIKGIALLVTTYRPT